MIEFQEPQKAIEWVIYKDRNFSVYVRGWKGGEDFKWNVYACIFDTHPFFGNVDAMMSIPLHGGPTYDRAISQEPAGGIKYELQKVEQFYKIGSDYSHSWDHYEHDSYDDGIPPLVRLDAEQLAQFLFDCQPATNNLQ